MSGDPICLCVVGISTSWPQRLDACAQDGARGASEQVSECGQQPLACGPRRTCGSVSLFWVVSVPAFTLAQVCPLGLWEVSAKGLGGPQWVFGIPETGPLGSVSPEPSAGLEFGAEDASGRSCFSLERHLTAPLTTLAFSCLAQFGLWKVLAPLGLLCGWRVCSPSSSPQVSLSSLRGCFLYLPVVFVLVGSWLLNIFFLSS